MFYLTTHSTHFIYRYMASDIWLRTILIVRKETRCRHIGYSYRLTARVLLYAPSHRQDNTYHRLCYTSRGALAGTRNSSMGPPWKIDLMTHRTMSERSYHGATSRSDPQWCSGCVIGQLAGRYWLQPRAYFKNGPVGRGKATTPSSLSLTSNRVNNEM